MVSINKQQSESLNALKVWMILFVIFIHENPTEETTGVLSLWMHQIVVVAVPVFFILSGFFFFKNVTINISLKEFIPIWISKIKARIWTLLIPYILWNILPILNICAGNVYSITFRGKSTVALQEYLHGLWNDGLWHIWWDKTSGTMPYDSPLWYVRDLMIICILSPFVFYLVHRMKWTLPISLSFIYIIGMWQGVVGMSITTITFFSIGASFALIGRNLTKWPDKTIWIISTFTITSYILARLSDESHCESLFILLSAFFWIILFDKMSEKIKTKLSRMSEGVFFILALHNTCMLAIVGKTLKGIMLEEVGYFVAPILTASICLSLYFILKALFPRVMKVICGNR